MAKLTKKQKAARKAAATRNRNKGKKSRSRGSTHSAATELGLAVSAYKIATATAPTHGVSPVDVIKQKGGLEATLKGIGLTVSDNAMQWDNDKWVLYGAGLHWAKNKPVAKIVLKPLDKLVKMIAGKRYGL